MTEYTSAKKRFCSVYKSPKKSEMYIYTDRKMPLSDLPEALLAMFGEPQHVLDMVLTETKRLARVEAVKVLAQIEVQGFYLQMPPGDADAMATDRAAKVAPPKDSLNG